VSVRARSAALRNDDNGDEAKGELRRAKVRRDRIAIVRAVASAACYRLIVCVRERP
jgi:hypothetical protein